jgi:hypothetical protein
MGNSSEVPSVRVEERPRRRVPGWTIDLLGMFFRYSAVRDAYVLRIVGRRRGPVLKRRTAP